MSHSHRPEFDALAARIKDILQGRPAIFFINPGNWGDSLIREGAEAFLRHYDIPYTPIKFKDILKKRITLEEAKASSRHPAPVMIYNGCGAFSPHYKTLSRVTKLANEFETAVFLPSTYALEINRSAFPKDSHFFVRDRFESQNQMPDCQFCHDMAFFLKPVASEPILEHGTFFREDAEAPQGFMVPKNNYDISKAGRAHTPIDRFLEKIGQYKSISTNRLHVGIAAALLGRQTLIQANDYFKIRAIYHSSMRDYFPNATFDS